MELHLAEISQRRFPIAKLFIDREDKADIAKADTLYLGGGKWLGGKGNGQLGRSETVCSVCPGTAPRLVAEVVAVVGSGGLVVPTRAAPTTLNTSQSSPVTTPSPGVTSPNQTVAEG